MVLIKGSITIEKDKKNSKRAVLRISGSDAISKFSKQKNLFVNLEFIKNQESFVLKITRVSEGKILQNYFTSHPYLQITLNKELPLEIWDEFSKKNKKTWTFSLNVDLDIKEWEDLDLKPWDFLPLVEKDAKNLMKVALENGFEVNFVPKGRAYDLELTLNEITFILGISSIQSKSKSRSKEKRKQKILQDVAKMLLEVHKREVLPVIVSKPLEFEGSWSYSTTSYLDFYKNQFNFHFCETDFNQGWENQICRTLQRISENSKLYKVSK